MFTPRSSTLLMRETDELTQALLALEGGLDRRLHDAAPLRRRRIGQSGTRNPQSPAHTWRN